MNVALFGGRARGAASIRACSREAAYRAAQQREEASRARALSLARVGVSWASPLNKAFESLLFFYES